MYLHPAIIKNKYNSESFIIFIQITIFSSVLLILTVLIGSTGSSR